MNNLDTMVEDYNSNFVTIVQEEELLPGDQGFDETKMLQEKYTLSNDATLCLTAPKAKAYYWELYLVTHIDTGFVDETVKTKIDFFGRISTNSQKFSFFRPDIDDLVDGTYELRLEVLDASGRHYRDACTLVIYDPFYGYY